MFALAWTAWSEISSARAGVDCRPQKPMIRLCGNEDNSTPMSARCDITVSIGAGRDSRSGKRGKTYPGIG